MLKSSLLTAKSFQLCLTLCDPIDGNPLGSPVPGILQTRTLEWVAISFSSAWKRKVKGKSLSRVQLLAIPWTTAYQAPPFMGFSRQEYWSGVPLPSPKSSLGYLQYLMLIIIVYILIQCQCYVNNYWSMVNLCWFLELPGFLFTIFFICSWSNPWTWRADCIYKYIRYSVYIYIYIYSYSFIHTIVIWVFLWTYIYIYTHTHIYIQILYVNKMPYIVFINFWK